MRSIFNILVLSIILFSCSSGTRDVTTKGISLNTDTLISKGNEVIFFKPNVIEFEQLTMKYSKGSGILRADSAFDKYVDSVSNLYKDWKTVHFPSQKVIRVVASDSTSSLLDRIDNGQNLYGIIYNNSGSEPVVEFGIKNNESLTEMVKRFEK